MTADTLKQEFLEYLEIERGRSLKTVENYNRYLSRFFSFGNIVHPRDITEESIRTFRLWLNRQEGTNGFLKKRTQNYYLIALRAFLKYLQKREVKALSPEKIELAKVPERSVDLITIEELRRLLEATSGDTEVALRDRAILELLFSTGLRVSELCALNADIDLSREEFSVRGKGEKVRVVFLSTQAKESVMRYLKARTDMEEPLFISYSTHGSPDRRLTPRSVERLIKHYAVKAGITKKVTPHIIRHSFATDLLQNGADIRSVQALLGHAHIATTQVYTHVTDSHLKEIHKNFHSKGR